MTILLSLLLCPEFYATWVLRFEKIMDTIQLHFLSQRHLYKKYMRTSQHLNRRIEEQIHLTVHQRIILYKKTFDSYIMTNK